MLKMRMFWNCAKWNIPGSPHRKECSRGNNLQPKMYFILNSKEKYMKISIKESMKRSHSWLFLDIAIAFPSGPIYSWLQPNVFKALTLYCSPWTDIYSVDRHLKQTTPPLALQSYSLLSNKEAESISFFHKIHVVHCGESKSLWENKEWCCKTT